MVYLDTSAFLKLYVRERESEWVQATIAAQHDPLPIWEILEMEFQNALFLKVFWGDLKQSEAKHQLSLFQGRKTKGFYFFPTLNRAELLEEFRRLSEYTPTSGCRTMDVLHVAFASLIQPDRFITFDDRQARLAKMANLTISEQQ